MTLKSNELFIVLTKGDPWEPFEDPSPRVRNMEKPVPLPYLMSVMVLSHPGHPKVSDLKDLEDG